ncbi:kinase-like domain-containing protein [Mycena albidolilacea]|uniref:non-specific serine/threonine protein kinase n=1 Tax=Mycena albidolilacea TaxID=1033008 RepID=A0AAD7AD80_9AGAR|nr:kinase-like domain-containing protein [Mycena albidolilacea]
MNTPVASSSSVDIWGYLEPIIAHPSRPRVPLTDHKIYIGRGVGNHAEFISSGISKNHATIEWNGRTDRMCVVTITDHDTLNGTFVDGALVKGINDFHQLFDGSTVCFGKTEPADREEHDFRYTFHCRFGRSKKESIFLHYIVGERIGGGLHGHVHRALEKKSGKVFALKMSWKHDAPDSNSIACAGQETMALMIMEHENIVRLHEVFFHINGEMIDMVLEYIDGISLQELLSKTRLSEVHAKELSFQLCRAVAFFHQKGVSHGDLKLDNVLLTRGDRPTLKIIDFGLANVKDTYNMRPVVTDHIFTAPEAHPQAASGCTMKNRMCRKWDDWGVGCIVFSMCVQNFPFKFNADDRSVSLLSRLASQHPFPNHRENDSAFIPDVDVISWDALSGNTGEAQHFVFNLLVAHPDDRMDAEAALRHPWLYGYEPYRVSFDSIEVLRSIPVKMSRRELDRMNMQMEAAADDSPLTVSGKGKQPAQAREIRLRSGRVV